VLLSAWPRRAYATADARVRLPEGTQPIA
jgi:hypothetical protein